MKLRNSTDRLVQLPTRAGRIQLLPNSFISVNAQLRVDVEKYVNQFGLTWELDDDDLPSGVDASQYRGSHAYAELHPEDDTVFDANSVRHQSDAEEIADVWTPVIERDAAIKAADEDPLEDLFFIKETLENEAPFEISEAGKAALAEGATQFPQEPEDISAREAWFQGRNAGPWEEVSDEGPDYLRAEDPDGVVLDIGLDVEGAVDNLVGDILEKVEARVEEKKSNYQKIEYDQAPPNCPYTKSELQLGVKSRLWSICDDLGLNHDGNKSKADLINQIFQYYDHN